MPQPSEKKSRNKARKCVARANAHEIAFCDSSGSLTKRQVRTKDRLHLLTTGLFRLPGMVLLSRLELNLVANRLDLPAWNSPRRKSRSQKKISVLSNKDSNNFYGGRNCQNFIGSLFSLMDNQCCGRLKVRGLTCSMQPSFFTN